MFSVKFKDGESSAIKGQAKSLQVYTDGCRMSKRALFSNETGGTVSGARASANVRRPFTFADIHTTGADYAPASLNHSVLFTCSWTIQMKTQYLEVPV